MSDFNITLFETCELLNRSKKSISRYIRRGLLHPERVKSQQGTLEYRFSKADIEAFKAQEVLKAGQVEQTRPDRTEETDQTGHIESSFNENKTENDQSRQDTPDQTRPDKTQETGRDNEVITLLKETTGLLKEQLTKKDEQIKDLGGKIDQLIERDRETNILLKGLQDKVLMLERPEAKTEIKPEEENTGDRTDRTEDETGQDTKQETEQETIKQDKRFWKLFK